MERKMINKWMKRAGTALFICYLAWFGIDIKLGGIHFWTNPVKNIFGL